MRHADLNLRRIAILAVVAAAAGVTGYVIESSWPVATLPFPVTPPAEANAPPAQPPPAANSKATARDPRLPAAQTAAVDLAPADVRRAAGDGDAAPSPHAAAPPPSASPPPVPAPDPAEIAAKMKMGADMMASGDIAAARTMFERVAEAGDAAGAFALAETYDPAVLRTLRLWGGITADPVSARRWYEKAREMGSSAAIDRIARLTRNSQ